MTDLRDEVANAAATETRGEPRGDFIWYELMTTDPRGAKAFYDTVVGWNISEGAPEFNGYRMIGRTDGGQAGGVLPLTEEMQQHGARPMWLGYLGVEDVDAAVGSIERAGGKAMMPAFDIPNIGRIAMVTDPQGVPFYVMKPIPPAGQEDKRSDVFSPSAEQRVGWNELATTDQAAALDFYTSEFGWDKGDAMPMGDLGDYQFINQHGTMLGAIMTAAPGNAARWRFYFRVPDTDAAADRVKAAGGVVAHGPMEVPGGDRILIGTDPQGAEFALVGK
jgi:predicted enzyme related to lactoylglutathione lyase